MQPTRKKSNRITLLIIILILGIFLFYSLIQFFTAFLGAVIFYVVSKKFMVKLTRQYGWGKSLAAILIMLISFFVILLPISFMGTMLYGKVSAIIADPQKIVELAKHIDTTVYQKTHFRIISDKTMNSIPGIATSVLGKILSTGVNAFTSISMMYFFLYFMLISYGRMEAGLILFLPFSRDKMRVLGKELYAQTLSNAVAIPMIAIAQGLCAYGAYLIAGLPEAGFWAMLTGFASIIPVVGATIIWLPIVIYLLASGQTWQGLTVAGICIVILGTADNVIRFIMAKKMADVHPVITILGVVMGLNYFGISGLIFGPLLISYFFILIKMYYMDYMRYTPAPPTEINVSKSKRSTKKSYWSVLNPLKNIKENKK